MPHTGNMIATQEAPASRRCPECAEDNPAELRHCRRCGLELSGSEPDQQLVGRLIGPFRLEAVRRRTATGTAFAAIDEANGYWVELKVLPLRGPRSASEDRRSRELSRCIAHPNLVRVLSSGEAGDFAYIATDARPEERPLSELGRQPAHRALVIASELARALACVHEHGLVYRNLSPVQVLVDAASGSVRLADLALAARLGGAGEHSLDIGSEPFADASYAAPETVSGGFSTASDLYSLGATLAYALTGHAPFPPTLEGRRTFELDGPDPLPGVVGLLRSLTAPQPQQRPRTATAVLRQLQGLLGEEEEAPAADEPADAIRSRSLRCNDLVEESGPRVFRAVDFQNLPQPLAQAALAAWNARPGLPRRMIMFLLWEGLLRLLTAIGSALLLKSGSSLPSLLRKRPFRPSMGAWISLARGTLQAVSQEDELGRAARELLFDVHPGQRENLLQFLDRLLRLRNESAHVWPQDEEVDLLSRLVDLSHKSTLFTTGGLLCIESATLMGEERVRYQPLELNGIAVACRGRPFTAGPGLAAGRLYWRAGRRFLALDPFWIVEDGVVLQLLRIDARRPRYGTLDGSPPRIIVERYAELVAVLGYSGGSQRSRTSPSSLLSQDAAAPPEAPPESDPFVGRVLGAVYRIVEAIGCGAMGAVYRGWDTRLRREVALKILVGGVWAAREVRQRFLNEARVLASVGHPHIVRVFEVGEEAGCLFTVMELLPGPTLDAWIGAQSSAQAPTSTLPLRQRVQWIVDAGQALHAVHQRGVVHRDVKPANLMLDGEGRVKVLDFGLAHVSDQELTRTRAQLGTPRYMAPEQILDAKRVGPCADVYSLGMSLYALLALERPFPDLQSDHDVLKQAQLGNLPRLTARAPGIPEELETIVAAATRPDEAKRYPSTAALADDLQRWLDGRPILARPVGVAERLVKYSRRHPARAVASLMLTLLLLGMGSMSAVILSANAAKASLLDDFGRLADLKRIADLRRSAESADPLTLAAWPDGYRALAARIPRHWETRAALQVRLQQADSLAFLATDEGFQAAWMSSALDDLLAQWEHLDPLPARVDRALAALKRQAAIARQLGLELRTSNDLGMELVLVPADSFSMGSPETEDGHRADETLHSVTLTRSYYLSACEVTQETFRRVLGYDPSTHRGRGLPVHSVSWYDALEFCNRLSLLEGHDPAYRLEEVVRQGDTSIVSARVVFLGLGAPGYRLPTEAEWEYACRAGTVEARYGELERVAWSGGDDLKAPEAVGTRRPNLWGLFDMLGNVSEWCWDVKGSYPVAARDPMGAAGDGPRVRRGGCLFEGADYCRAASRATNGPSYRTFFLGFRVARSIPGS